jgi:hypothetical protein
MKTQCEKIAEILDRDGRIDNFYAIHSRLTLRLGARIWDLKNIGYEIRTEQTPEKNTIYWLISKPLGAKKEPKIEPTSHKLLIEKDNQPSQLQLPQLSRERVLISRARAYVAWARS